MATNYAHTNTSQRGLAMLLSLASAVVLSPLYVSRRKERTTEGRWSSSGFVLPVVLAGLIIAIKTTSVKREGRDRDNGALLSDDPSWVLRIGGSSWGLAGVLVMLMLVLSWQHSVQHFFWR